MNSMGSSPYMNTLPQKLSWEKAGLMPNFWPTESIEDIEIPSYLNQILTRKQMAKEVTKKNIVWQG